VILLPYEMQISDDAAGRYRELGIGWEDGFLERSTQRAILEILDGDVEALDAYGAFVEPTLEARKDIRTGEFFVFNRGDKIDYNHPTREGHRRIADYALRKDFCLPPGRRSVSIPSAPQAPADAAGAQARAAAPNS